jgi:hypothetical protein
MTTESHSFIKSVITIYRKVKFIFQLLNRDETARLGSGPDGISQIKAHPFFKKINWKKLGNFEIEPPFKPTVERGQLDTSNFDAEYTDVGVVHTPCDSLSSSQENLFRGFSYERRTPDMGGLKLSESLGSSL